ncbi:hypothetical protein ACOMHN_027988 [Nucella lapillus]
MSPEAGVCLLLWPCLLNVTRGRSLPIAVALLNVTRGRSLPIAVDLLAKCHQSRAETIKGPAQKQGGQEGCLQTSDNKGVLIHESDHIVLEYSYIVLEYTYIVLEYSYIVLEYTYIVLEYSYIVVEYSYIVLEYSCVYPCTDNTRTFWFIKQDNKHILSEERARLVVLRKGRNIPYMLNHTC